MLRNDVMLTLEQLLDAFNTDELLWGLTWIEAITNPTSTLNIVELEERVKTPPGLHLTQGAMRALAADLAQVIECEVTGFRTGSPAEQARRPVVRLLAEDSSHWTVSWDPTLFPNAASALESGG
jgi:hypothetical protein